VTPPVGTLCVVLHTHLPWLARHGTWPVGEEWLHQAWAQSYLPLLSMLHRLRREGRRDLLTLGLTPVLAAQLDDPYLLREHHLWLGRWRLRA
jgi:1,4-alpha-glucan branching enzyme